MRNSMDENWDNHIGYVYIIYIYNINPYYTSWKIPIIVYIGIYCIYDPYYTSLNMDLNGLTTG